MRDTLIEFMDSLREYVAESGTNIAHDERDSSEFVDIFLNKGQALPIDIVVRSAITYEQFQEALKIVNEYKTQLEEHYKIAKKEIEGISKFANVTKETKLYDTDLSVRCLNILRANDDKLGIDANWEMNVKELSKLSMSKFLQCRVAGKKTLQELKELCFYADVKLLP
jgi:DNA-directed RNA polymerase alpha subunit